MLGLVILSAVQQNAYNADPSSIVPLALRKPRNIKYLAVVPSC